MFTLDDLVRDFARGIEVADALRPQAVSSRTKTAYLAGIGPHSEAQTTALVLKALASSDPRYRSGIALEVPYLTAPRSRCDLCLGAAPRWEWCLEVKMLRLMGDNGKPNDNILMHILSPYPAHRSALTDCEKLLASGLNGRKAILIYGFDYAKWPMDPAIEAFEALARRAVHLSNRCESAFSALIHPVHQMGRVFAWELEARAASKP